MPRRADKKSESTRRQSKKGTTAGKPSASRRPTEVKAQAGSTRKSSGGRGVIKRVVSTVLGALTRKGKAAPDEAKPAMRKTAGTTAKAARVPRRTADIPMDQIASTYTPTQTSLKGPFRTSGADRQRDQEFATGAGDERWNDEDRFTNKSGDPRIGTHGRTYEPGEKRAAKSRNEDE